MHHFRRRLACLLCAVGLAGTAAAHEVRPALLQLTERADGRYDILWKQPTAGAVAVHLLPRLSGVLPDRAPTDVRAAPDFRILQWRGLDLGPAGLAGRTLAIDGLGQTMTDVLVAITRASGDSRTTVLHPRDPPLTLAGAARGADVAAYGVLGIEHILTGADHLCFVLGLLLLVSCRRTLILTITAFTLAHSITLAATTLHLITVQPALIEALVALSILFVAVELARAGRGRDTLAGRYPWVIAFAFGLLHGAAFAGALADIGLPPDAIPQSLFLFNVGVECGQLLFVAGVLGVARLLGAIAGTWPAGVRAVPAYAIGALSVFWLLERLHDAAT